MMLQPQDKLWVSVILGTRDITLYANPESWELDEYEGSILSTLNIELRDTPEVRELAGRPTDEPLDVIEWSDIYLIGFRGSSYSSAILGGGERLFAGMVSEVATEPDPDSLGLIVTLNCLDWKALLDRNFFSSHFYRLSDKEIIRRAFLLSGLAEINFEGSLVQESSEVLSLSFQSASLRQLMDTITEQNDYIWDINKDKELIHEPEVTGKPIVMSFNNNAEGTTESQLYNFVRTNTSSQFNEVELHGAVRLSDVDNQLYSGNGRRRRFTLSVDSTLPEFNYPRITRGPESSDNDIPTIDVWNVTTNSWDMQSVGIEGSSASYDVYWNPALAQVEFVVAPPDVTEAWRISGRSLSPITLRRSDLALQLRVGHIFRKILVVPEVDTQEEAERVATTFLKEQAAFNKIAFNHDEDGVHVGDLIEVSHSRLKIDHVQYTVYQNTMRHLGNQVYQYKITANLA